MLSSFSEGDWYEGKQTDSNKRCLHLKKMAENQQSVSSQLKKLLICLLILSINPVWTV